MAVLILSGGKRVRVSEDLYLLTGKLDTDEKFVQLEYSPETGSRKRPCWVRVEAVEAVIED